MGTGSRGGGGSGGGGSGGGSIAGGYRVQGDQVISKARPLNEVENLIRKIFRDPNRREYLLRQFSNPLIRNLYEHLFSLYQQLVLNRSWSGIQKEYGIEGGPGCLKRWVDAIFSKYENQERDQRMRDVAKASVKYYLFQAIGNNIELYLRGSGSDIVESANQNILQYTSNNFLAGLIREVVRRERELSIDSAETEYQINVASTKIANRVVDDFVDKFRNPPKVSYKQLLVNINANPDWFLKALRA